MASNLSSSEKLLPIPFLDDTVELWVKEVLGFSSEYNTTSWSASSVIGTPRVFPRYGDIHGAWAQQVIGEAEFITVEFEERLYVNRVDIYETLNAGAVVKIQGWDHEKEEWCTLWETLAPQVIQTSRIFSPTLVVSDFLTNRLKLTLNCSVAGSWCEIDAIKLTGCKTLGPKPPPLSVLAECYRELVNSSSFSDVQFKVDDQIIYAHRAVLSVRSEYFRAMFCNGLMEGDTNRLDAVDIQGVGVEAFLGMMHYLYTNSFNPSLSPLNMSELIRAGDRFSLEGMKTLSYCSLSQIISVDNVIDIYVDAVEQLPRLEEVEKLCIRFISHNLSDVTKQPSFCRLPHDLMLQVIQEGTANLCLHKKEKEN